LTPVIPAPGTPTGGDGTVLNEVASESAN